MPTRFAVRVCGLVAMALLIFAALGPANWQLRTGLGWKTDHFVAYLAITPILCLGWSRPLVVGVALMVIGTLLEGLQAFTPDRRPDLLAAFWGAAGAFAAALVCELLVWGRTAEWAQVIHMRNQRIAYAPPGSAGGAFEGSTDERGQFDL
jgi:hypothetical protein